MFKTDLTNVELQSILDSINKLGKEDRKYIEVGVWEAGTFLKVLEENGTNLNCIGIDLFEDFLPSFDNTHTDWTVPKNLIEKALLALGHPNFILYKGESSKILLELSDNYFHNCVCFIDGNHTYEGSKADFNALIQKNFKGYVVFHNSTNCIYPDNLYYLKDGGVYKLVEELKNKYSFIGLYGRSTVLEVK